MNGKLYRSRDNKVISGVCSGLGEFFEIDPIIFRFGFVALLFAGGSSILIYLILLIIIPKEPLVSNAGINNDNNNAASGNFDKFQQQDLSINEMENSNKTIFGLLLISFGALFLLQNLIPLFNLKKLWPAILIIIGLGLLFQKTGKEDKTGHS